MAISPEALAASYNHIEYRIDRTPHSPMVVEGDTLNCQTFVHRFYKDHFGVELPLGMWSRELIEDTEVVFRDVDTEKEQVAIGDIVAFVPRIIPKEHRDDPKKAYHLTIYLGENTDGVATFLHANSTDGGVSLWTVDRFSDRYERIGAVKRVKDEIHQTSIARVAA